MSETSDWDLFLRTQDTGAPAFGALVQRYFRAAVAFCAQVLGDHQKAEDLAQRGFARLFQARSRYERRGPFRTLLFRVLLNLCLNELQKRTRTTPESDVGTTSTNGVVGRAEGRQVDDPARVAESKELDRVIREAVDRLPPKQRAALFLREYQGFAYQDIASALDVSLAEVKVSIHRARRQVLELLRPYLDRGDSPR